MAFLRRNKKKGENNMKKLFASILAAVAILASSAASMGCMWLLADEPTAPKSMID